MKRLSVFRFFLIALVAAVTLASCATVNHLERVRLDNPALASVLEPPPSPSLDAWSHITIDPHNPVGTAFSVGTTIIKAAEAQKAGERMREALTEVDVPGVVFEEASARCARVLDASLVRDTRNADYVLDIEIEEYGIDAPSWSAAVSLQLQVTARLFERGSRDLLWRRHVSVSLRPGPEIFGLPTPVETIVTAAKLASLSTEEMARGFAYLAHEAARTVGDRLESDLQKARGGW